MSDPVISDTLTGFAKVLAALGGQFNSEQIEYLSEKTGFREEQVNGLFNAADEIVKGSSEGASTLERSHSERDIYTLTGERAAWIGIEDPRNPGRGFDLRIRDTGDGPIFEVWMMKDEDIPLLPDGTAPYEPIASQRFTFSDYIDPDEEDETETTSA